MFAHYICNLYGSGPAPAPVDEKPACSRGEDPDQVDALQVQKLDSFPMDVHKEKCGQITSKCREEAGQVLLLKGGVYWDSPSTVVPASEDAMICKNSSASLQVCSRESAAANVHTCTPNHSACSYVTT